MRERTHRTAIAATAAMLAACVVPVAALAGDPASDRKRVETLVRERAEAGARGDVARWRRQVADDCIWIGGSGLRTATTSEVAAAQIDIGARREILEFDARAHGDVVIATYLLVEHVPADGAQRIVRTRKLDTYRRRGADWVLIANAESLESPPRRSVAIDPGVLDRYVGRYRGHLPTPVTVRIWREADGLRLIDSTSEQPATLSAASETEFYVAGEAADWVFVVDASGRAGALLYRSAGAELRFDRED